MICSICLENIYFLSYKSKCRCKLHYHNECIINWYKYKKICPICKEVDNIKLKDINKSRGAFVKKIGEFLIVFCSIMIIIIFNYTNILKYINLYHIIMLHIIGFIFIN